MQFNITFFIQIINFYITYWFLNNFLFKSVINFIEKEKLKEAELNNAIKEKQNLLLNLEYKKSKELSDFQNKVNKDYKAETVDALDVPKMSQINLDEKEIDKITKITKDMLVERVPHVD